MYVAVCPTSMIVPMRPMLTVVMCVSLFLMRMLVSTWLFVVVEVFLFSHSVLTYGYFKLLSTSPINSPPSQADVLPLIKPSNR